MIDERLLQVPPLKMDCPNCRQRLDLSDLPPEAVVRCPNCRQRLTVPRQFAVYQLFELLQQSDRASVYQAYDPALDRPLAIKILHPYKDPALVVLQREIFYYAGQISAWLNQPAVARVYSVGEEAGLPFQVMELLTARTLAELGRQGSRYDLELLLRNLVSLADALGAAAVSGVGHHELWPGNLLLDADGLVRILNFLPPPDPLAEPVIPSESCPFIRYLSPERLTIGEESVASDVYSLGVIAYELLSGVHPFELCDLGEMIDSQYRNSFVSLARREPSLDAATADLIDRMINGEVGGRPEYPEIQVTFQTALERVIEARNATGLFARLRKYLPSLETTGS